MAVQSPKFGNEDVMFTHRRRLLMSLGHRNFEANAQSTRRSFLKRATAIAVAAPTFVSASRDTGWSQASQPILAWVGTYSALEVPECSGGRGRGIHLFELDPRTGALAERSVIPNDSNPAWLELDPSRKYLYSANHIGNDGTNSGSVSAYSIDHSNGHLNLLNTVSSQGAGPAHLSVHPSGKYVLVANYAGGTLAVLPTRPNGELGPSTDVQRMEGPLGPKFPTSAPPGSCAVSGHDSVHPHMVHTAPSGQFVISTDLGRDKLMVWKFDLENGKLLPNDPPSASLPPGDGPRHFAFHPNGQWLYSLQEEASTLALFHYDNTHGMLVHKQTVSTLPREFVGTNFPSEIRISADGQFAYAANRMHDSIALFSIGTAGRLTYLGEEWTRGGYPVSITIDPTGNFMYSLNENSAAITVYRVDRRTGSLTFTNMYTPIINPTCMVFLEKDLAHGGSNGILSR